MSDLASGPDGTRDPGDPPPSGTGAHAIDPVPRRAGADWLVMAPDAPVSVEPWLFDAEELRRRGRLRGTGTGRRPVWFFRHEGTSLVLRHYWRGGLLARLTDDVHPWSGLRRSRPYRELALLGRLAAAGLPVPRPVAARIARRGPVYRGDLLTVEIPDTAPLTDRILAGELTRTDWRSVGRTIRRFHDAGAHHADLNARNILLADDGTPWILDWDKGRLRGPARGWTTRTLRRLRRSLGKDPALDARAREHWDALVEGHREG